MDGEICTMRKILPDSFALVQWGVNSAAVALSQQCPGKLELLNNLLVRDAGRAIKSFNPAERSRNMKKNKGHD